MRDYKVLTNSRISMIILDTIQKVAPTCLNNREGMTKSQENDFVDSLMSKLNVNEKQARFLMKYKNGDYRKKLLEIEGIQEDFSFDGIFKYIDASKCNTPFILVFSLLCVLAASVVEIAMIFKHQFLISSIVALLLSIGAFVFVSSLIKLIAPKYSKICNDKITKDEIAIKKIKLKTVNQLGHHPIGTWAYGLKIIGVNKNKSGVSIIYPINIQNPVKSSFNIKKEFNEKIINYYRICSFTYLENKKIVLDSSTDFNKITKQIIGWL